MLTPWLLIEIDLTAISCKSLAVCGMPQPIERIFFELTHPFSADAELCANVLIGGRFFIVEAVAKVQNLLISIGQRTQGIVHIAMHGVLNKDVLGRQCLGIGEGFLKSDGRIVIHWCI